MEKIKPENNNSHCDFTALLIPNFRVSGSFVESFEYGDSSKSVDKTSKYVASNNHLEYIIDEIKTRLKKLNVDVLTSGKEHFPRNIDDELIKKADVIIALGGDGTIIHIAKRAAVFQKPVLGINCGNLGFMAAIEHDELDKIYKIIAFLTNEKAKKDETYFGDSDNVFFQKRMMIKATLEREGVKPKDFTALNEITISRDATARMITFDIFNCREKIITYHADGVIVASPTGSTAYSLSAGGPIVDPAVECLIVNPICPHALFARAYIFSSNDVITLKIKNADTKRCRLSIDGEKGIQLNDGDVIRVTRSADYARIIMISDRTFYNTLNQKLINRR